MIPVGIVASGRRAASGPTVVVSDSFTRANSAVSMGTADTGQTWLANDGTWGITSNRAYCTNPANVRYAAVNTAIASPGTKVIQVSARFYGVAGGAYPFVTLHANASGPWSAGFRAYSDGGSGNVLRIQTGTGTSAASAGAIVDGDLVTLCATPSGGNFDVTGYINGALVCTLTAQPMTATAYAGLSMGSGSVVTFDDFKVETIP